MLQFSVQIGVDAPHNSYRPSNCLTETYKFLNMDNRQGHLPLNKMQAMETKRKRNTVLPIISSSGANFNVEFEQAVKRSRPQLVMLMSNTCAFYFILIRPWTIVEYSTNKRQDAMIVFVLLQH